MSKGGMCKNPFAGNASMNELDDQFMAALFKGELTVDQAISLRIIKMSVRDYLYFGLGKNGITPEKFLEAYAYLFKVRGTDPRTWGSCDVNERYKDVDSVIQIRKGTVSPEEIRAKSFDTHFDLSGLSGKMDLSRFLKLLAVKRREVLSDNRKQVLAYMDKLRAQEWKTVARRKGKHAFSRKGFVSTLVAPETVQALAKLYLFGRTAKIKKVKVLKEPPNSLKYKALLF